MPYVRINRKGKKLVSSTIYVPKDVDSKYARKAKTLKVSKSKMYVDTLCERMP